MKDLLDIEKEGNGGTITMDYIHYQKNMLRLVKQAYEDGWNAAIIRHEACDSGNKKRRMKMKQQIKKTSKE